MKTRGMISILSLVWVTSGALAVGLEEGESALAQARRDYFQAIMDGTAKTPEERSSLYKKTVGDASSKLDAAISDRWKQAFIRRSSPDQSDPNAGPDPSAVKNFVAKVEGVSPNKVTLGSGDGSENSTGDLSGSSSGPTAGSVSSRHKDTALDGSGIPRLLEFGQKPSRAPASPSSDNASP